MHQYQQLFVSFCACIAEYHRIRYSTAGASPAVFFVEPHQTYLGAVFYFVMMNMRFNARTYIASPKWLLLG
jgi:hypothetical protein